MSIVQNDNTTAVDINSVITAVNNEAYRRGNAGRVTAITAQTDKELSAQLLSINSLIATLNSDHAAPDGAGGKIADIVTHTYGSTLTMVADTSTMEVGDGIIATNATPLSTDITTLTTQTCGCNAYQSTYCCNAQCCNTVHCCDCYGRSGAFSRDRCVQGCPVNGCTCDHVCSCEIQ